ncbi:MAG TPA: hypothetical protein VGM09_12175 [Bradyrhizobium sp.]
MRVDQRGHEGRVKASPLGRDALEGNGAAADPVADCDENKRKAEQGNPAFQIDRWPGAIDQDCDDRRSERDAAGQNSQYGTRILRDEKGNRAGKQQRQIGDDQLKRAVIIFDGRCRGDRCGQHASQR